MNPKNKPANNHRLNQFTWRRAGIAFKNFIPLNIYKPQIGEYLHSYFE
jgi:hypothetical protein